MNKSWDIFCKVVDNFGDIGICWRLAQQLAHAHGLQVRLFVDNLSAAQKIIPELDLNKKNYLNKSVEIIHWLSEHQFDCAADVVVEAFSCGVPQAYLANMQAKTVWVNLEYLSAESWVADFHAKPSIRGQFTRHFYFPGFTDKTGGLLREGNLIVNRNLLWQKSVTESLDKLKISLFCYETAPLQALFHELSQGIKETIIFAPLTDFLQPAAAYFGKKSFEVGDKLTTGSLTLEILPFLSQEDYDKLLWTSDINFVRGEDSWIRAIWAGKPFIWQPYPQTEATHIKKLNAFLDVFYTRNQLAKSAVVNAHLAWSTGNLTSEILQDYLRELPIIRSATLDQSSELAKEMDLTAKLVNFCETRMT
jgi:uncharacterized repeat protein (TIGR03837 family)